MAWVSWGYRRQFSLGNSRIITKMIPDTLQQLWSLLIVETSRSARRLCSVPWLLWAHISAAKPLHTITVTGFSSEMSFNFPFAWRQQGGLRLASPLSFIPQLVRFQIHAEECLVVSVPLPCGSTPCGNDAKASRNLPLLWLTFNRWWRWVSPVSTSYLSVTPDDCLWSMKPRSLFLSVATEKP